MSYKVRKAPVIETIPLLGLDDTGETKVTVRQATWGASAERKDLMAKMLVHQETAKGKMVIEQSFNVEEAKALDIFLTLEGMEGFVDEEEKPWSIPFREKRLGSGHTIRVPAFDDSTAFYAYLKTHPAISDDVVNAIYEAVLKVNPHFQTSTEGN